VAGTAFLPWEEWLARLLHPLAVAIKRRLHEVRRRRCLDRHRGGGHPPTPATPPCVRIRTRRFDWLR